MKTINKYFKILILLLAGLISKEIKADYANGQFADTKTPNHIVTEADVKQVAYYIDRNEIIAGKWYTLNSGFTFKMDNPSLFKSTMLSVLSKVTKTTATSIRTQFDSIQIIPFDDNISVATKNYNMRNGKLGYSADYKGGKGVRMVMVKGYPVLKVGLPCFNPNEPEIATQRLTLDQPAPTPAPTPVVTKAQVQETETVVDDECWEYVTKKQKRLVTETYNTGEYYAGIGDFSGSRGNRMPSESVTTQYYDEQLVLVEQPCGTTIEEELPIASNEEYEEAKVATREGRPFYIVLNIGGQFNFSKAGNYSGGGTTGGGTIFQPKTPGGNGGGGNFTPRTPGGRGR